MKQPAVQVQVQVQRRGGEGRGREGIRQRDACRQGQSVFQVHQVECNAKDTRSKGVRYDDELPVQTDDPSCRVSCNTGH